MSATDLKEMRANLDRLEATTGNSGAIPRTPKEMMLDATDLQAKNPDKHYRFVNVGRPEKAQSRLMEGYTPVPETDGGRTLGGSLKLMSIPRQAFLDRVARQKEVGRLRLSAHKTEMEQVAEGIARQLRDNHGIKVDASRILISE